VEAVAWTAIGLLAVGVFASFGSFYYAGTRIDALGARLDVRIDAQRAEMSARIERLDSRVDARGVELGACIDAVTARMDEHLSRHSG
jgi:hypothetical protein